MNQHPRVVFFVHEKDGQVLLVRRGEYLGLPGDTLRPDESIFQCAKRVLSPITILIKLDEPVHAVGGACSWDGQSARFDIYSLPGSDMLAPAHPCALCTELGDDPRLDTFVEILRSSPHNRHNAEVKPAA